MITEFVKFKTLDTTTEEELLLKADILNNFQKAQDGYINAELIKDTGENTLVFYLSLRKYGKGKSYRRKVTQQ